LSITAPATTRILSLTTGGDVGSYGGLDSHALLQVGCAVVGEAFAWCSGLRINCDHPPVVYRQENPSRAIGGTGVPSALTAPGVVS
jgi:hypothetical protein